jgi:hypothetical protein
MYTLHYYIKKIHILFLLICFSSWTLLLRSAAESPLKKTAEQTKRTNDQETKNATVDETDLEQEQEMSLEREQKRQEKKAGIDTRSLQEVEEQTSSNRYSQTEAYFQIPAMRELVFETFNESNYKPVYHMDIISRVMSREASLNNKYWAFYHGHINDWMLPQDVFKELNNHFRPEKKAGDDFIFVRFTDQELPRAQEFLEETMKESGLIDDNGNAQGMLLSTNVSLFGNTAFKGESTWRYFMTPIAHVPFKKVILEEMMTKFGVTHKYIDELLDLLELIRGKEQTLLQIFIPKNIVDDVGYISWITGIPAHQETIDWVRNNVKKKVYKPELIEEGKGKTAEMVALEDLQQKFQKQREKNPLYKEIMQSIEEGDYSANALLKIYCNKPWDLPNINFIQARLVLSTYALLNPDSGIKFFRYTTVKPYMMEAYKKRLHDIIQKIVAEKEIPERRKPARAAAAA